MTLALLLRIDKSTFCILVKLLDLKMMARTKVNAGARLPMAEASVIYAFVTHYLNTVARPTTPRRNIFSSMRKLNDGNTANLRAKNREESRRKAATP